MNVWKDLEPKEVFRYFEEICSIPHGSGNIQKISDYYVAFAKEHDLRYRQDEAGNVIIRKDAAPGYENGPTVILQGHMDMVAVKTDDCDLDMSKDGLRPAITEDGAWVYARGTSLGGDDGIAEAMAMAILADDTIPHPALEAVFTVNEEIGMLGAEALDVSDLKGKILLNMDSEDDGIFMVGCAGGGRSYCKIPFTGTKTEGPFLKVAISGLTGGHSGEEIHKERGNANMIMGRLLYLLSKKLSFRLCSVHGGAQDNVIASTCQAILTMDSGHMEEAQKILSELTSDIKSEYDFTDPDLQITAGVCGDVKTAIADDIKMAMTVEETKNILSFWIQLPAGIQRRTPAMLTEVQTSLNLGVIVTGEDSVSFDFCVRSAVQSEKEWLFEKLQSLTEVFGGSYSVSGVYPAWTYASESPIRDMITEEYERLTGRKAVLKVFHAGVECGLFTNKIPGLDCISYGPQMQGIHSVNEKLNIASVKTNYELTLAVLKNLKGE